MTKLNLQTYLQHFFLGGGGRIFARHKWQVTLITILNSPIIVDQIDFLELTLIFIIRSNVGHINFQSTLNL